MSFLDEKFSKKYDDHPKLKGGQKKLPDALQKGIIGSSDEEENLEEELPTRQGAGIDSKGNVVDRNLQQSIRSWLDKVKDEVDMDDATMSRLQDKIEERLKLAMEAKKTIELPADTTFTLDLKHLMKKHIDEGKSQEDVVRLTKKLMDKLHDKGEVKVDGTKVTFVKENNNLQQYKVTFRLGGHYGRMDKKVETVTAASEEEAKNHVIKKYGREIATMFDGTKMIDNVELVNEADVPMDMPIDLPEPKAEKPRRKGPPRLVAFDTDQDSHFLGDDHYDYEGGMAKSQILKMKNYAKALCDMIEDESQLESWVQAKLTKASDYMSSVFHYLDYQKTKMDSKDEMMVGSKPETDRIFMADKDDE